MTKKNYDTNRNIDDTGNNLTNAIINRSKPIKKKYKYKIKSVSKPSKFKCNRCSSVKLKSKIAHDGHRWVYQCSKGHFYGFGKHPYLK